MNPGGIGFYDSPPAGNRITNSFMLEGIVCDKAQPEFGVGRNRSPVPHQIYDRDWPKLHFTARDSSPSKARLRDCVTTELQSHILKVEI